MDTPEEDGIIYIKTDKQLKNGEFVTVTIKDRMIYDLIAEI